MDKLNPDNVFFLAVPIDNIDGTFNAPDADGKRSFSSRIAAYAYQKDEVEKYGVDMVVFRCEPVRRRGPT